MAGPGRGRRDDGLRKRWARWKKPEPVEALDPEEAAERDAKTGRSREPQPVGPVVRGILGEASMHQGLAIGRLMRRWHEVVGPELAERCAPAALDPRGLLVAVESPAWATQVSFLGPQIVRRTNDILGREEVSAVRATVDPVAAGAAVRTRRRTPSTDAETRGTKPPR